MNPTTYAGDQTHNEGQISAQFNAILMQCLPELFFAELGEQPVIPMRVQGIQVPFLIDTSATFSTLDQELVESCGFPPSRQMVQLSGLEGRSKEYPSTMFLSVTYGNASHLPFSITPNLGCN